MKKIYLFFIGLTSTCILSFVAIWFYLNYVPVVKQPHGSIYFLAPGTSKKKLIEDLGQQQVISHPIFLSWYFVFKPTSALKTGEYFFPSGSTLSSIFHQITTGTGIFYHQFTIIPGWTFEQIKASLVQKNNLKHELNTISDQQLMTMLRAANIAPEGAFFPDTYYYAKNTPDITVLKMAFNLMQKQLNRAWLNRQAGLPYQTPYEALIVASMIEKEAHLNQERPIISGVILNRLNKNMLLQIDPTVIYGLGADYSGSLHESDLTKDTPYNTYLHKGLPPTPISVPSMPSIWAALHPTIHQYLYFVAKGDGSHQFSENLPEHHSAVLTFLHKPVSYFNEDKIKIIFLNRIKQNEAR